MIIELSSSEVVMGNISIVGILKTSVVGLMIVYFGFS